MKRLPAQIFVVLLSSWVTASYADIMYGGIVDVAIATSNYELDFNGDDIADFTFEASGPGQLGLQVEGNNRAIENIPTDLAPLEQGFAIGSDISLTDRLWSDPGAQLGISACMTLPPPFGVTCSGEFYNQTAFMGAEFEIAGETHYGWIRVQSTMFSTGVILDYAYESTPGQGIIAGVIPEPSTIILFLVGAIVLATRRHKNAV